MASLMTSITIKGVTLDRNFLEMYFFYFFYGIASVSLPSFFLIFLFYF